MRLTKRFFLVSSLSFLAVVASVTAQQVVNFELGSNGLTSLTYGSNQMIPPSSSYGAFGGNLGSSHSSLINFKRSAGTSYNASQSQPTGTLNSTTNTVTIPIPTSNPKANIECRYVKTADTTLDFCIVIKNLTSDTIVGATIPLIALATPAQARVQMAGFLGFNSYPNDSGRSINNNSSSNGDPAFISASTPPYEFGPQVALINLGNSCVVSLCNLGDPTKVVFWEIWGNGGSPVQIRVKCGRERFPSASAGAGNPYDTVQDDFRVMPNAYSDTLRFSLRFTAYTAPGTTTKQLIASAPDVFMKYGGYFPYMGNFPDRRAVGYHMVYPIWDSDMEWSDVVGDLLDSTGWGGVRYISSTANLEKFRNNALKMADELIGMCKASKKQGFIMWDFEGSSTKFPQHNPPSVYDMMYIGDPDMVDALAPEWNYKGNRSIPLDVEFFKKIRDAGFEPGMMLRAQNLKKIDGEWKQADDFYGVSPEQEVLDDIDYAYKRWGIKLFYLDSPVWASAGNWNYNQNVLNGDIISTLPSRFLKRVHDAYPDVSIMIAPEVKSFNTFQWNGGYADGPTTRTVQAVWPDAFSMNYGSRDYPYRSMTQYISGVLNNGEVIFFPGNFPPDSIAKILSVTGGNWNRPTTRITYPRYGDILDTTFTITATAKADSGFEASNPSRTITRVEFLSAGIVIGQATSAPYTFTWTVPKNLRNMKHSLYARAVNNINKKASSAAVNVFVKGDGTPIHVIQSPGLKAKGPMSIMVYALNGRLIRKVDFENETAMRIAAPTLKKGLSSGIYVLKTKSANGKITRAKMDVVW